MTITRKGFKTHQKEQVFLSLSLFSFLERAASKHTRKCRSFHVSPLLKNTRMYLALPAKYLCVCVYVWVCVCVCVCVYSIHITWRCLCALVHRTCMCAYTCTCVRVCSSVFVGAYVHYIYYLLSHVSMHVSVSLSLSLSLSVGVYNAGLNRRGIAVERVAAGASDSQHPRTPTVTQRQRQGAGFIFYILFFIYSQLPRTPTVTQRQRRGDLGFRLPQSQLFVQCRGVISFEREKGGERKRVRGHTHIHMQTHTHTLSHSLTHFLSLSLSHTRTHSPAVKGGRNLRRGPRESPIATWDRGARIQWCRMGAGGFSYLFLCPDCAISIFVFALLVGSW